MTFHKELGKEGKAGGAALSRPTGYGLFSIRERLTSLGSLVKIDTRPGQGTQVSITVPLEQQEAAMV